MGQKIQVVKSDLFFSSMTVTCIYFYFVLLVRQNVTFGGITIFSNTFGGAFFTLSRRFIEQTMLIN